MSPCTSVLVVVMVSKLLPVAVRLTGTCEAE